MQSSFASPSPVTGIDDLYEPVDVQQLQDDSPLLLQEEMLDLMNMNPMFGDEPTTLYPHVAAPRTETDGDHQPLVHLMDMDEDELAEDGPAPLERAPATMRARPSTIGRMLFPTRLNGEKPPQHRAKRLSAPIRTAEAESAPLASPVSRRISLPVPGGDDISRTNRAAGQPAPQTDAVLLALPAARQLQTEKTRLRELQTVHAQQEEARVHATDRIRELEQALDKARLEQEGWQAEAQQLAARLEAATSPSAAAPTTPATTKVADDSSRVAELERALALESSKRRRGKELQSKLRCELVNRRWKEKWEVELLERVERELEIKLVQLEAQVVLADYEREMERLERAEVEENLAVQTRQVANLSASRQILLTSFRTSEQTATTLRADLSALQSEVDASVSLSAERIDELEAQVEELAEVKAELTTTKKELLRVEKADKKADVEKRQKELVAERSKREKLESEVKALRAQLKTTESALKAAEKASLGRSSSTTKATRHPTSDVEQDATELEEVDVAHGEPMAITTTTPDDAVTDGADEPEPAAAAEEPEEAYKPSKSKSRSGPAPKLTAAVKESKKPKPNAPKAVPEAAVEEDEPAAQEASGASEAESAPPTPKKASKAAAEPTKKRKANVLGDKSTNARDADTGAGFGLKVKKAKKAADGTKVSALALAFGGDSSDDEEDGTAGKSKKGKKKRGEEDAQAKKQTKKRTLLGPRKKFDWTAESANIDSMIPVDLSPIKKQPPKKTTGLFNSFLNGPPGKASIF
ncbi:hypothetical protein JCM3774_002361 [Rhodotorula dairenensis]